MVPLIIAALAAIGTLSAVSTAGSAVASSVPLGLWKKNREQRKAMRLGINTERQTDESFELFEFEESQLPASMHWMVKQKWVVTEKELFRLLSMVRREMLDTHMGPFAEATQKICVTYGISYMDLAAHSRMLSGKVDYEELVWLSNNRLADRTIQKKLLENG